MKEEENLDKNYHELINIIHFLETVSSRIYGILDSNEIYRIISTEFAGSKKYSISIVLLTEDKSKLRIAKTSILENQKEKMIEGEKIAGVKFIGYQINLYQSKIYSRVIKNGETLKVKINDVISEISSKPIAFLISKLFGFENRYSIITPLLFYEEIIGAIGVASPYLAEYFIPSVKYFAKHFSAALVLSHEYQERLKLESLLVKNEKKYRTLIENTNDIIFSVNEKGELTYISPQISRLGVLPEEIISKNATDIIYPVDKERVLKEFQYSMNTGKEFPTEFRIQDKEGNIHWFEDFGRVQYDESGKITGLTGILREITEKKQAEVRIRRMGAAVEQSIDGIAISDLEEKLVYVNSSFAKMHGFLQEEMIGMEIRRLHHDGHMDDYKKVIKQIKTKGFWEGEIEHIKKDGIVFPVYMSISLLKNDNSKATGILSLIKDITNIIQTKNELEKKNIALKELLSQIEQEKEEIKSRITENVSRIIMPVLDKIKNSDNTDNFLKEHIKLLELSLKDICSSFLKRIAYEYIKLTPREIEICQMVKNGLSNKEIAKSLSISLLTVEKHRQKIRKKLGIKERSINLYSYLHNL